MLHRIPRGLLYLRIDRGRNVAAAGIASGEEVGQPPPEQALVGAVEHGVLGALQARTGIAQRIEAGDGCIGQRIRVDAKEAEPAVGGHRVGEQLAAGGDLAALARVLVEQHPLVSRVRAQTVGRKHLCQCGIGQQQHDQRHDCHGDAAQRGVHTFSITSVLTAAIGVVCGRVTIGRRAACEMRTRIASST